MEMAFFPWVSRVITRSVSHEPIVNHKPSQMRHGIRWINGCREVKMPDRALTENEGKM